MNNKRYQYHVFNDNFSFIVTSILENEEYAIGLAKRVAKDYHGLNDDQLQGAKANFIIEFHKESVINVDMLSSVTKDVV